MNPSFLPEEKKKEKEVELSDLIVFNDDVHTFEFVIETLMDVCGHDQIQAEQCTSIIHFNGKCGVKRGTFLELKPKCEALIEKGLSATIE
jgi:ATP-dependent Clp protease adaptor protein ClpS